MKILVSSLITGMEQARAAARSAITVLGHEPVMAEDFGALPRSPQVAGLDGERQSAAVVLILGTQYGSKQLSGLSATHEEYQEARDRCPVLAFVQAGVDPEPDQAAFIREVQGWKSGLFRDGFTAPSDLQAKVIQAVHRMELATATAPFDAEDVLARAIGSFPVDRGRSQYGGMLLVAVAGGPSQAVLRPTQMEDPTLAERLEQEALFGSARIFARGEGTSADVIDGKLVLEQDGRSSRLLSLDAQGGILIRQPVESESSRAHGMSVRSDTTPITCGGRSSHRWGICHANASRA